MRREVAIHYGNGELVDKHGSSIRADIVVYRSREACAAKNQGQISFLIECKAPNQTEGYSQLVSYIYNTSADGGVWYNGSGLDDEIEDYRRIYTPGNHLTPWIGMPRFGETVNRV